MSSSSTQKSIKITYTVNPPPNSPVAPTPGLPKTKSTDYPISPTEIPPEEDKTGKAYYGELRKALEAAKTELGEDLTRWRDLVGKAELNKEPKTAVDEEDVEDEES